MSKSGKLLSVLIVCVMLLSLTSVFCVAGAVQDNTDRFLYSPFQGLTSSKFSSPIQSNAVFVCNAWRGIEDGAKAYLKYGNEVYSAIKGVNAFDTISQAVDKCSGRSSLCVKVGPGNYTGTVNINDNNVTLLGNYAGVCPNMELDPVTCVMPLNPERVSDLESNMTNLHVTYVKNSCNVTIDGFKITKDDGKTGFVMYIGTNYSCINTVFQNNIVSGMSGKEAFLARASGTSAGTYIRYNRFEGNSISNRGIIYFGHAALDSIVENNYFANNDCALVYFDSCGNNNDVPSLFSFSKNVVNNCDRVLNIDLYGVNAGTNYDYKKIEDNIIYHSGEMCANYNLEIIKEVSGARKTYYAVDTRSKTSIKRNQFLNIANGTTPIRLTGVSTNESLGTSTTLLASGNLTGTRDGRYSVNINENLFAWEPDAANRRAANFPQLEGIVDATRNFYGDYSADGNHVSKGVESSTFSYTSSMTQVITSPYYVNPTMKEEDLGVGLAVKLSDKLDEMGFDSAESKIDDGRYEITLAVKKDAPIEQIDVNGSVVSNKDSEISMEVYRDFALEDKVKPDADGKLYVDITDVNTYVYFVLKDSVSGESCKYKTTIRTENINKEKAKIRKIINNTTHEEVAAVHSDNNITVNVESKYVNFPFSLVLSPSATAKIYTDDKYRVPYVDDAFFIAPDTETKLYVRVTSGDGEVNMDYTITFSRKGDATYDAKIKKIISPQNDILLFDGRKRISYNPYAMITSAKFDFEVSDHATFEIYRNYDESTGEYSELVSSQKDNKEIPVEYGMSTLYVKVISEYGGYSQVYTLNIYNDVRSTDNTIKGITGLNDLVIPSDKVIRLDVSSTIVAFTAHFETDPFAKVTVYADENKQYALTPAVTMTTVNNREVEERTFSLGVSNIVSRFYIDVESEVGEVNSYQIVITKPSDGAREFTDMAGKWSEKYVNEASRIGIITGYPQSDGTYTFGPDQYASRQEVAAMICRSMGIDPFSFTSSSLGTTFDDSASISEWAFNYVKGVYFLNIMVGSDNAEGKRCFNPSANITRQEFFESIANLLKLDKDAAADYDLSAFSDASSVSGWALPATKAVVKAGIIDGSDGKLNPKANITRAEIAKIVSVINTIHDDV